MGSRPMKISATWVRVCAAALGLAVLTSSAALAAKPQQSGKLGHRAEQLLTEAQQAGQSRVVLLIAAKAGASTQAVAAVSRLGGRIEYRDDSIGYLRASVPISQVKAVAA